jgi:cell division topological specificity factor
MPDRSDLLAILREEILAVIVVERDNVVVRMDRGATVSTLEIDIEIPTSARTTLPVGKRVSSAAMVGKRLVQSSPQRV